MEFLNNQPTKIVGGMPKMKGGTGEKQYVEVTPKAGGHNEYDAKIVTFEDICGKAEAEEANNMNEQNVDREKDSDGEKAKVAQVVAAGEQVVAAGEQVDAAGEQVVAAGEQVDAENSNLTENGTWRTSTTPGGGRRKKARKSAKKGAKKSAKRKSAKRKSVKRKGRK